MRRLLRNLPVLRLGLFIFPIIFASRTATTALWSTPSGPYPLNEPVPFDVIYWSATAAYLYWATIAHKHLLRSAYIGMTLGLLCMYRAVTVIEARATFGNVALSAVVNWVSFSLSTLIIMTASIQYIMIKRLTDGVDE